MFAGFCSVSSAKNGRGESPITQNVTGVLKLLSPPSCSVELNRPEGKITSNNQN